MKICKGSGLTINQSKRVDGENYIVINYRSPSDVKKHLGLVARGGRILFPTEVEHERAKAAPARLLLRIIEVIYKAA